MSTILQLKKKRTEFSHGWDMEDVWCTLVP